MCLLSGSDRSRIRRDKFYFPTFAVALEVKVVVVFTSIKYHLQVWMMGCVHRDGVIALQSQNMKTSRRLIRR